MQTWTRHTLMALSLAFSAPCSWAIGEFSSTKAEGSAQLCPEPLTMLCAGPTIEEGSDGALLQTMATVAMSPANKALHPGVDFAALAQYDPLVLELPVLKALASSNAAAGYLTKATADAVQAYTYTGTGAQSSTLMITVDATMSGQDNRVIGGVAAYAEDYLSGTVIDGPGTLLTNPVSFSLSLTGSSTKSITFTLDPGESVYLEAFLSSTARSTRGPSVADAFNSMTMSFTDITGLAVATPVPEAGSLPMLCAGLALLAGFAGRRPQLQSHRLPQSGTLRHIASYS
jgi:PEP-CTERM motif